MLSIDIPLYIVPFARAEIRCGDKPCADRLNENKIRIDLLLPKSLADDLAIVTKEPVSLNTLHAVIDEAKANLGDDAYPTFVYFEQVSSNPNIYNAFSKIHYYAFLVKTYDTNDIIAFSDMILYPQIRFAYLPYIFVKPAYQNMSLGSLLLRLHSLLLESNDSLQYKPLLSVYNESYSIWSEFTEPRKRLDKNTTTLMLSHDTEIVNKLQETMCYIQGKFMPYMIFLHVKQNNIKARSFYEKHNFKPLYILPNMFYGTNGIVYCKSNFDFTTIENAMSTYNVQTYNSTHNVHLENTNNTMNITKNKETYIRSVLYISTEDTKSVTIETTIKEHNIATYLENLKCEYKWTTYQSPAIKPYTHFLQSLESKLEKIVLQGKTEVQLSPRMWYKQKQLYWLGIDFDAKQSNNIDQTYQDAKKLVRKLVSLGLKTYVSFTGGGFHVLVLHLFDLDNTEYAFQNIRHIHRQTIQSMYPSLDVISSFRMTPFRGPGTKHPRGIFMYPYYGTEFLRKNLDSIIEESKIIPNEYSEAERQHIGLKIVDSWTIKSVIDDINSIKIVFTAFGIN